MSLVYVTVLALIAANAAVSFLVARADEFTVPQRALQLALVWLIPVVGAALCWAFVSSQSSHRGSSNSFFPLNSPSDGGGPGSHGGGDCGSGGGDCGGGH